MSTSRLRSLADDLRARDDAALVALLRARPDLLSPVPSDLASLAARSTTRPSVTRALDQLDRFTLQVVEVLCALPDRSSDQDVRRLLGTDPTAPLARLHAQALVYRDDDGGLVVPRTVAEVIGPPAGLGPPAEQALHAYGPARLAAIASDVGAEATGDPVTTVRAVAGVLADPGRLPDLVARAPAGAADALATMAWGPPTGHLERARREVDGSSATSPVEWLLAHGLLVATDAATVVLPREVGLHLRGGRVHRAPEPSRPPLDTVPVDPQHVDRAAAGAAADAVRLVEELLELWAGEPPKVLRTGGVGVRERARAAAARRWTSRGSRCWPRPRTPPGCSGPATTAGTWPSSGCPPRRTTGGWASRSPPAGGCWPRRGSASTRVPGLVGGQDQRGRTLAPLGPDLDRSVAPDVRAAVLADLARCPRAPAPRRRRSPTGCAGRRRDGAAGCRTTW